MHTRSPKHYERLWLTLEPLKGEERQIARACERLVRNRCEYEDVERLSRVPWVVVGAVHSLEADCDLTCNLHNGEPLRRRTRLAPKGRGPFTGFVESALDALQMKRHLMPPAWTIGEIGRFCEAYNGWGYCRRGKNSPYIWAGSNHGVVCGKFVSDGCYDTTAESEQVGVLVLLNALIDLGEWSVTPPSARRAASRSAPAADRVSE